MKTELKDELKGNGTVDEPIVDDPKSEVEDLVDHFKDYLETGRELYVLKLLHRLFAVAASALVWGVVIFLGLIAFLFLSISAALWVGSLLENNYLGFLIVAGFYALVATLIFFARDKLIKEPFESSLIDKILND